MNLDYTTKNIFPVPIHTFDVNGFEEIQNDLIDYAYGLKNKEPKGVLISNRGGWQSSCFLLNNEDELEKMSKLHNPYGDGFASKRIVEFIKKLQL